MAEHGVNVQMAPLGHQVVNLVNKERPLSSRKCFIYFYEKLQAQSHTSK